MKRQPPFEFNPRDYNIVDERLDQRIIESDVQTNSLDYFLKNPASPQIYGVGSAPCDSLALYFAGYLANEHAKQVKNANIVWHSLHGGFKNPLLDKAADMSRKPTLLVLHNLTPDSTSPKVEKARDLLRYYDGIPRIVVIAGTDPYTFFLTRLYLPLNGLFFSYAATVNQQIKVL